MTTNPSIRLATERDVPKLIGVLSRAFVADPFVRWLVGPSVRDAEGLSQFYRTAFDVALPRGHVFTNSQQEGAALWLPPSAWAPGWFSEARTGLGIARAGAAHRIIPILRGLSSVQRAHPKEPHYYLFILGVEPERQGQGWGSRLMQPVLERCNREGIGAYLETALERDIVLYRRHGFEITQEIHVSGGGPKMWGMWRKASAHTTTQTPSEDEAELKSGGSPKPTANPSV